jgi:hypothetical protein
VMSMLDMRSSSWYESGTEKSRQRTDWEKGTRSGEEEEGEEEQDEEKEDEEEEEEEDAAEMTPKNRPS